ncbi:hypothetical protein [Desulfuribacillus alkaliarsenatis]|uniref:Uncharacterized protein n=1 Tax=Desulfuribacillus alkaliarsenatis TaxID=766136 RepID=A0A1E5G1M2_9FIRM|nr:hypothetical protein [Desulfuribacillus alkaliarsenatis]OEF96808.1 hypothetical protein BHF68_07030 [Desulfuribacillus alkaliarsenatis]
MIRNHSLYVLFAVAAFIFYHFVVFPLFLDYGLYGVLLTVALLGVLAWMLPKEYRLSFGVVFIGYLLLVRGMMRMEYKPVLEQIIAFIALTLLFIVASKILASKVRVTQVLTLCIVGGLLTSMWSQQELFFAKKFQVIYESPKLYSDTNIDYFPLQLADVTGDGTKEIITQGVADPQVSIPGLYPMQMELSRYMVFSYEQNGAGNPSFMEIGTSPDIEQALWNYMVRDYVGFPYYTMEWSTGSDFIHRYKDARYDLLDQGFLQMDFFHKLLEELSVETVDNMGITPSFFTLWDRRSAAVLQPIGGNVDISSGTVDNLTSTIGTEPKRNFFTDMLQSLDIVGSPDNGIYELLVPRFDRLHLIQHMLPFGRTPFAALGVSMENIEEQKVNWAQVSQDTQGYDPFIEQLMEEGVAILGYANLTGGADTELVTYRDGLEVYQKQTGQWQLVATLRPDMLRQVADGEFIFADVTGNGVDEVLLSATPSQVLRLVPSSPTGTDTSNGANTSYTWKQLWVAQDDVFRFETVTATGEIIALSQSYYRNENRRFLTGYRLESIGNGSQSQYVMKPQWRTNNTVINVRVGDITGDGNDEYVASYFREHRFVVLQEHGLPVQQGAWLLTLLGFVVAGWHRVRYEQSHNSPSTESTNIINKNYITTKNVFLGVLLVTTFAVSLYGVLDNRHVSAVPSATMLGVATDDILYPASTQGSDAIANQNNDTDGKTVFSEDEWRDYWQTAVNYSNDNGERFWYSGWVVSKIQKRRTTSMYDGIIIQDEGISVNARMLGNPFRYYESGDYMYLHEDNMWKRLVNEAGFPVDWKGRYGLVLPERMDFNEPFKDLLKLVDLNDGDNNLTDLSYTYRKQPTIVGEERILGELSDKITFTLDVTSANGMEGTTMEWTVWVGKDEPYIYQYEVESLMPVPDAGMMQQTTFFRFWNFNDEGIQMTNPLAIEKQIVDRELRQIENIEHALYDEEARSKLTEREILLLELRLAILQDNVANSIVNEQ